MTAYLPRLDDLVAVGVTWAVGAVLLLNGACLAGRRSPAELQIASGWGALCLLLTLWGVFTPWSLRLPAATFILASAVIVLTPRRPSAEAWRAVGRILAVSLPLWLVLAPIRPSQPDTFLNLLPNAFYLVDHARFPTALSPPSDSLLPGAPYNTQFLSFLGSFLDGDYPASGMPLISLTLQLVAGLAIARALDPQPSWAMTAAGFLAVSLLNPGFVPRVDLSAYAEPALAVTTLLAAWSFVIAQTRLAAGRSAPLLPLALVLAGLVNAKQSGVGLLMALAGAAALTAAAERGVPRPAALRHITVVVLPAVLLYLEWRYYVGAAGVAELKLLPVSEWNWGTLPATAVNALAAAAAKPAYFGCVGASFVALTILLRRQGWTPATRLLFFHAALFILYNAFLLLTYLAHFPREMSIEAHSFFRYNTHLSLVLVLALALAARDLGAGVRLRRLWSRPASAALVLLALLTPIGFAGRLRFDLDMPQPLVWDLAKNLGGYLHDGDRAALLLPGDNDSVAEMIVGVLSDTPPRRRGLDLLRRNTADPAALAEAARLDYPLALISCTAQGEAALLRHDADGWHEVAAWPYPSSAYTMRWQHILAWQPLYRQS
jgi:hypothetical protein